MLARARCLGLTQSEVARRAEVAGDAMSKLVTGKRWPRPHTLDRIDAALAWPRGTIAGIAAGADPVPFITRSVDSEQIVSGQGRFVFNLPAGWDHGMSELERLSALRRAEAAALDALAQAQRSNG